MLLPRECQGHCFAMPRLRPEVHWGASRQDAENFCAFAAAPAAGDRDRTKGSIPAGRRLLEKQLIFCHEYVSLIIMKQKYILRQREQLALQLPMEIVRGSLLKRTIRHRRGCAKCARGEGHTVWVLTVGYAGGNTRQISLRAGQRQQVARWLKNYRELRARIEAICEWNQKLLRSEE